MKFYLSLLFFLTFYIGINGEKCKGQECLYRRYGTNIPLKETNFYNTDDQQQNQHQPNILLSKIFKSKFPYHQLTLENFAEVRQSNIPIEETIDNQSSLFQSNNAAFFDPPPINNPQHFIADNTKDEPIEISPSPLPNQANMEMVSLYDIMNNLFKMNIFTNMVPNMDNETSMIAPNFTMVTSNNNNGGIDLTNINQSNNDQDSLENEMTSSMDEENADLIIKSEPFVMQLNNVNASNSDVSNNDLDIIEVESSNDNINITELLTMMREMELRIQQQQQLIDEFESCPQQCSCICPDNQDNNQPKQQQQISSSPSLSIKPEFNFTPMAQSTYTWQELTDDEFENTQINTNVNNNTKKKLDLNLSLFPCARTAAYQLNLNLKLCR